MNSSSGIPRNVGRADIYESSRFEPLANQTLSVFKLKLVTVGVARHRDHTDLRLRTVASPRLATQL